ncbi:hypothetical protein K490DRAFT_61849 [Saccharata proteae CBS 121410]|uniref:Uncharacterized protein n=1 Tax=Saccharata proteae CBS 121410 TaxID=1314787 RepID=A0A9P4HWK7_9PEZI|nr:hypothetical protein K490DRAFT_61849 [Saccharata proteae CBS 121410]
MLSQKPYLVSRNSFLSATQPQGAFRENGATPVRLVRATIQNIHDNEKAERPGPNDTAIPAHPCRCPICHEAIDGVTQVDAFKKGELVITGCQPSCYGGNPVYHLTCIKRYLNKPRADRPGYYEHRCPCCKRDLHRPTKMGFTERLRRKTQFAANTFERASAWMDTPVSLRERRRQKRSDISAAQDPASERMNVQRAGTIRRTRAPASPVEWRHPAWIGPQEAPRPTTPWPSSQNGQLISPRTVTPASSLADPISLKRNPSIAGSVYVKNRPVILTSEDDREADLRLPTWEGFDPDQLDRPYRVLDCTDGPAVRDEFKDSLSNWTRDLFDQVEGVSGFPAVVESRRWHEHWDDTAHDTHVLAFALEKVLQDHCGQVMTVRQFAHVVAKAFRDFMVNVWFRTDDEARVAIWASWPRSLIVAACINCLGKVDGDAEWTWPDDPMDPGHLDYYLLRPMYPEEYEGDCEGIAGTRTDFRCWQFAGGVRLQEAQE